MRLTGLTMNGDQYQHERVLFMLHEWPFVDAEAVKKTLIDVRVFIGRTTLESYTSGSLLMLQRGKILLDPGHE
jgi:hypothetical protein